jgi:hypothetical protein
MQSRLTASGWNYQLDSGHPTSTPKTPLPPNLLRNLSNEGEAESDHVRCGVRSILLKTFFFSATYLVNERPFISENRPISGALLPVYVTFRRLLSEAIQNTL